MKKLPFHKEEYYSLLQQHLNSTPMLPQVQTPARTVVDELLNMSDLKNTKPYSAANTSRN